MRTGILITHQTLIHELMLLQRNVPRDFVKLLFGRRCDAEKSKKQCSAGILAVNWGFRYHETLSPLATQIGTPQKKTWFHHSIQQQKNIWIQSRKNVDVTIKFSTRNIQKFRKSNLRKLEVPLINSQKSLPSPLLLGRRETTLHRLKLQEMTWNQKICSWICTTW